MPSVMHHVGRGEVAAEDLKGVRTRPRCTPSGLIMTYEISLLSVAIVKLCVKLLQEVGGQSLIRSSPK